MSNARRAAYQILLNLEKQAFFPDRLISIALQRHMDFKEEDRALLTELVYGVLRWRGRLDWHIDQLSRVEPSKIKPEIRVLLRLALYQLLYLSRVPDHAAVNEAVKIAKSTQPPHLVGFVNALLREAVRCGDKWEWPLPEADPVEHLAVTTSHPRWFVRRCLEEFGLVETRSLCQANNTIGPLALRVNTHRIATATIMESLAGQGLKAEPSPYLEDAVRVTGIRQNIAALSIFEKGWIQVQDEASQVISLLLDPHPGERILDICAGFGGKSTHVAGLMRNEGEIVAVDQSPWKLEELRQNARRQHLDIIGTITGDALDLRPERLGSFDRVLLDAPCSGFGTLRRKPDIKWRRHLKDPYRFSQLQKQLLDHASLFVKPGGVLIYATCTIFSEENQRVADEFGERHEGWELESIAALLPKSCRQMVDGCFFRSWPHLHGTDGFFAARWRRIK
jgi:16S rRNA (cytosine967-C5)-methyltransferase